MEILPLLDIFWNGFASNLSVRFECSDRDSYAADLDLKSLDKALHELGKMDSLNLKKTSRLLWIVEVDLNAMFQGLDRSMAYNFKLVRDGSYADRRLLLHRPLTSTSQIDNIMPPTFALQFQTDMLIHLAGVRIDARDLLQAGCVFLADTNIIVRVCGGNEIQNHMAILGDITKYVLVLMEKSYKAAEEGDEGPLVEVELNHDCLPVQVTYKKEASSQLAVQDDEKKVEEVDIASLHKLVALHDVETARNTGLQDPAMGHKCYERPRSRDNGTRRAFLR
ncbi:hypothetical protein J4E91_009240 [Alternaria rosae]|nr:hypothetical protein J4E91_009240 [Alternaria rosae]